MERDDRGNSDSGPAGEKPDAAAAMLALVGRFVAETRPGKKGRAVTLESRLDRDLAIDSLSRTELVLRIENGFGVRLPIGTLAEARTVGDLVAALARTDASLPAGIAALAPKLAAAEPAFGAATLVEALDFHAARHPDRLHVTVLEDDRTAIGSATYGELQGRARRIAAGLIRRGVEPGDRVALMLPTGLDFFAAFCGALYAGGVPVPIYPPGRLSQIEDHLRRQAGVLRNAGVKVLVTMPEGRRLGAFLSGAVETLAAIVTAGDLEEDPAGLALPRPKADDLAMIQYTSGSTGDPKGVMLTHANLLANVRAMAEAMDANSADVMVSWLPLYHDMGLIGAWLAPLHHAVPVYVMSPLAFLARPEVWLRAIDRFRGTISASPNFGFDLCLNKIDDARIEGLDLSSLRLLANGSEPIYPQNLRRFVERFARFGLPAGAVAPVYGLAESTVGLSFPPLGRGPRIDRIDREALARTGRAEPARADDPAPQELAACGSALRGHEIRIVDATGREVGERQEGRLQFRGPSATPGYFRNEEATAALIRNGWHESGDRAYLAGGEVHITGRNKDIIIRGGRNLYPQEVENVVALLDGVRKGGVVLFGADDPTRGTEELVLVAETREKRLSPEAAAALEARIREAATEVLGEPPETIVLARPQSVPKTSSGKLRRSAARDLYLAGRLGSEERSVRWQLARLGLSGAWGRARGAIAAASAFAFAAWWWTVLGLLAILGWAAVMVLPSVPLRWRAVRALARASFRLSGLRVTTTGVERLGGKGGILACNHASYTDPVLLAAVLPGEPVFIAKRELAGHPFAGPAIRRLGGLFVERYDLAGSLADAAGMGEAARAGRLLVVFPEGTFTRQAGLAQFRLGAFQVAAEAGVPVFPGILRGTRALLRGDQWFPRRVELEVEIGAPLLPEGAGFDEAVRLRDAVRAKILAGLGESDLGDLHALPVTGGSPG